MLQAAASQRRSRFLCVLFPLALLAFGFLNTESFGQRGHVTLPKPASNAHNPFTNGTLTPAITAEPPIGSRIYLFAFEQGFLGEQATPILHDNGTGIVQTDPHGYNYVLTDSNGDFDLTGLYASYCPDATSPVYLLGLGGDTGFGANSVLALADVMPVSCSQLPNVSGIEMNQLTTVAAAYAVAPLPVSFVTYDEIFTTMSTTEADISNDFTFGNELVSGLTGVMASTLPDGGVVPAAELNMLADIVASCVNSDGTSTCTLLFAATTPSGTQTPSTDSYNAMLNVAKNPTNNVQGVYSLVTSASPFAPILTSAPADWTLDFNFSAPLATQLSFTSVPASLPYGTSIGVSVTASTGSGVIPTGSVVCFLGQTQVGSTALNAGGVAGFEVLFTPAGNNVLSCNYAGNSLFAASSAQAAIPVQPTVTLTSAVNPAPVTQPITLTATLGAINQTGAPVPNGTLSLYSGTTLVAGPTPVSSTGSAQLVWQLPNLGGTSMTAVYSGDAYYSQMTSNYLNQNAVVPTPTWSAAGSMTAVRVFETATLLNNGNVLIAGGSNGAGGDEGAVNTAEIYTPGGGFASTGNMFEQRFNHTATLLSNGTVLIAGGENYESTVLSEAEIYNPDPTVQSFSPSPGYLNYPRTMHTATTLQNNTVLIAGGLTGAVGQGESALAPAEIYTPPPGPATFAVTGSLNTPRWYHTATLLQNGMVLIVGGRDNNGDVIGSAELYNPATSTFSYTGSLNTARALHAATLLQDGTVLISGGCDENCAPIASAELYNPATGAFSYTASLNTARAAHSAVMLNGGSVLLYGGLVGAAYNLNDTASAELYIPGASGGIFTPTASLNTARSYEPTVKLATGTVLAVGGEGNGPVALSSAETYADSTITGTINPKYIVLGITYAPPGPSSSVSYQNSTYVGNTATFANSYSNGYKLQVSVGNADGISGWLSGSVTGTSTTSFTQLNSYSNTVTTTGQTSNSWHTPGTPNAFYPVDHDYDYIWIWLNPLVKLTVDASQPYVLPVWNGYAYNMDDQYDNGANDGPQGMDIWPVYVGCLNGDFPTSTCAEDYTKLARTWASGEYFANGDVPALTSFDYGQILGFDPFATNPILNPPPYMILLDSNYPANTLDGRYTQATTIPAPGSTVGSLENMPYPLAGPGVPPPFQTYMTAYSNSTTASHTASNTTTQSFSLDTKFKGSFFTASVSYNLMATSTLQWMNSETSSITNTQTETDTAIIYGPPCNAPYCTPSYSGVAPLQPANFDVFQDNLFGTFMFYGTN